MVPKLSQRYIYSVPSDTKRSRLTKWLHEAPLMFFSIHLLSHMQSALSKARPGKGHDVSADRNERETNSQDDLLAGNESQIACFEHTV